MKTWLEVLKPNTKYITKNELTKTINLIHPHWSTGKSTRLFRELLKGIKSNSYKGYLVIATGFISLEGLTIAHRLQQYIDRLDNVEYTKFNFNIHQGTYTLEIKFK